MIGEVGTQRARDKSGRLGVTTEQWSSTGDDDEYSSISGFYVRGRLRGEQTGRSSEGVERTSGIFRGAWV